LQAQVGNGVGVGNRDEDEVGGGVWGWSNNCDYEIIVRGLLQMMIMTNDGDNEQRTLNNEQRTNNIRGQPLVI